MKKTMMRVTSLVLAMLLVFGQFAVPANAADGDPQVTTVLVTDLPGGDATEAVEVDITVTPNADGTVTATASTPEGGHTTDSGTNVEYESTTVTDADGKVISEDTSYTAVSADGTYFAKGGTETSTTETPDISDVTVDLVDANGNLVSNATAGGESTSVTTPTREGDKTQAENAAYFDQTTVTETDRKVEVEVSDAVVSSGDPVYVDENGNPLPTTDNGYNYFAGVNAGGIGYSVNLYTITKDENGNDVRNSVENSAIREWKTQDDTTGQWVDGMYCVDASISTKPYGYYRLANLEDAVEEGYYTEEEADHLRAIVSYGYTWESVNNKDNVDEVNEMLYKAGILNKEAGEALSSKQAAAITQAAIWTYANRFEVESKDLLPEFSGNGLTAEENEMMIKACTYLTSLTMEAPEDETQVINEEKFVEDMTFTVGEKADNVAENEDNDHTNDVYNTTLKFSMVITPDKKSDDLIVKVLDDQGNVVKQARLAGDPKEGESFGYAATETDENGNLYYVLEDMQLSENSNTTFNLKLEGTQLLKNGVYVFEGQNMDRQQFMDAIYRWGGQNAVNAYSQYTDEELAAFGLLRTQNYITSMEGTADVDVGIQIDLTFNVEEATVTTTRVWRNDHQSKTGTDDLGGRRDPRMGHVPTGVEIIPREAADGTLTILDEEVPLAAAPATGDASILFALCGLASTAGYLALGAKKKED